MYISLQTPMPKEKETVNNFYCGKPRRHLVKFDICERQTIHFVSSFWIYYTVYNAVILSNVWFVFIFIGMRLRVGNLECHSTYSIIITFPNVCTRSYSRYTLSWLTVHQCSYSHAQFSSLALYPSFSIL